MRKSKKKNGSRFLVPGKVRLAVYPLEKVFDQMDVTIPLSHTYHGDFDGDKIRLNRFHLLVFLTKGTKCVNCGIEGQFFAKECDIRRHGDVPHLSLYSVDDDGQEVLMTKDHIVPVCHGGYEGYSNMQPMCMFCNNDKSDQIDEDNKNGFYRADVQGRDEKIVWTPEPGENPVFETGTLRDGRFVKKLIEKEMNPCLDKK